MMPVIKPSPNIAVNFVFMIHEVKLRVKRSRMKIFAQRIKELRKEKKKTQVEIAAIFEIRITRAGSTIPTWPGSSESRTTSA